LRIACVHIPRFAVEAERQRRSDIASRLILLGEATVLDCSLGADASGVKWGMRMSEAIGLCPQALVLPPDVPHYERRFEEILDFLEEASPEVEPACRQAGAPGLGIACLSLDGLPVDVDTLAEELIAALHQRLEFMASVGVADGKFAARTAACITRPGATKVVPAGDEAAFLSPLSVDLLPADEAMRWRLQMLGLETLGDIARLPLGAFQAQFGPQGKRCWELAQGMDCEPLRPRIRERTVVRRLQMPAPAVSLDAILMGLERLVFAAYGDPARGGRWVRKAVVRATLDRGGSWDLPVPFREALANPGDAWFAVKAAVVRRPPERPVEELEVELVGLSGESGKQAGMFDGKGKLWRQVEEAVRQLGTQQERPVVGKVVLLEPWSRIPERRSALAEFGSEV